MWRDYWQRYRQYWWVGLLLVIVLAGGLSWRQHEATQAQVAQHAALKKPASATKKGIQPAKPTAAQKHQAGFVDLKGAVEHAGIYPIKVGQTRLFEVIEAAGGSTEAANLQRLNLSQKLADQMVIHVPKKGETISDQALIKVPDQVTPANQTTPETGNQQSTPTEVPPAGDSSATTKINLNQADSQQLQQLTGIGPKKAEQIIAYRQEQGKFKKIEELQEVSGIGEKTFAQLQAQICVD